MLLAMKGLLFVHMFGLVASTPLPRPRSLNRQTSSTEITSPKCEECVTRSEFCTPTLVASLFSAILFAVAFQYIHELQLS